MSSCVAWTRCEACTHGCCYEQPTPHPWADEDDRRHARQTGQPEPTGLCACPTCGTPPTPEQQAELEAWLAAHLAKRARP